MSQYQIVLKQAFGNNKSVENKEEIQKIFARLLGTSDDAIVPQNTWQDGKRPEMSLMNLWVACQATASGFFPPSSLTEGPKEDDRVIDAPKGKDAVKENTDDGDKMLARKLEP